MPSRVQLKEFQTSFMNVGNEAMITHENFMHIENVELPENEPPTPFPEELDGSAPAIDTELPLNIDSLGLDLPPESFTGSDDADSGFDFGDLLGDESLGSAGSLDSFGLDNTIEVPVDDASFNNNAALPEDTDLPGSSLDGFLDNLDLTGPLEESSSPIEDTSSISDGFPMENFSTEDFSSDMETALSGEISAGMEAIPDFGEPVINDMQGFDIGNEDTAEIPDSTDGVLSEPGLPEISEGASNFSDIEFPDIDLSQALDMGGEAASFQADGLDDSFSGAEDLSLNSGQDETGSLDEDAAAGDDFTAGDLSMDLPGGDDFAAEDFGVDTGTDSFDTKLPGDDFSLDGIDLGSESTDGSFDAGSSDDDFNFAGAEGAFDTDSSIDLGGEDLGGDDFGTGISTGLENVAGDTATGSEIGIDDFNIPQVETGGETLDSFDNFTAGDDWNAPETSQKPADSSASESDDFGDFSLSGFDDIGAGGKPGGTQAFSAAPGRTDEIEEIRLSENEYQQLQDTLSVYPLNLRIACEELIAEQAVDPKQMSALVKLLVRGAPARETALLAGKILGKTITIPKGYTKKTGAELEAEQASFGYIFAKRFLPILRLAGAIALVTVSLGFLIWNFAIIPIQADRRYKEGYALIQSGEYVQANERFRQAFEIKRVKNWFYRYAEAFRDERQYTYAERKYDELLRVYPRDKKGALDYAAMETHYIKNYEKADRILRTNILDYSVNDKEALLALAENSLAWGETDYSRYEEARSAYSRLMEKYGRQDPYLEGMLKYFIRTDQLKEVLPLQSHFMSDPKKRKISVPTLAELGGYLLDKRFEETEGVPEEYADQIEGIRDVLIRAINADGSYPESYYHLARYYTRYGSGSEERQSLRDAIRAFSAAPEESPKRVGYHIDTQRRYAEVLINAREFFPAEEELIIGVRLYEDARARGIIKNSRPEFGRLYADLGDLEFFVKSGDMDAALRYYQEAERNDYLPPEVRYRMGVAYYQNELWEDALMHFFVLTSVMPTNRRLLYALGNTSYLRGNYFAAQGYYTRLMDLLDAERIRSPAIFPGGRPEEQDLAERIMVVDNNLGVTLETLTRISGDTSYRSRALYLFSEAIRAWDVLTRDPESMARMRPIKDLYSPGINLPYLNTQNILHPSPNYEQQIFMRIDRDSLEPSDWEALIPRDYRLSDQLPMKVE